VSQAKPVLGQRSGVCRRGTPRHTGRRHGRMGEAPAEAHTGRPVAGSGLAEETMGKVAARPKAPRGNGPGYAGCDEADPQTVNRWGDARARLGPPRAPDGDRGKRGLETGPSAPPRYPACSVGPSRRATGASDGLDGGEQLQAAIQAAGGLGDAGRSGLAERRARQCAELDHEVRRAPAADLAEPAGRRLPRGSRAGSRRASYREEAVRVLPAGPNRNGL
jgi:hypothetical protein